MRAAARVRGRSRPNDLPGGVRGLGGWSIPRRAVRTKGTCRAAEGHANVNAWRRGYGPSLVPLTAPRQRSGFDPEAVTIVSTEEAKDIGEDDFWRQARAFLRTRVAWQLHRVDDATLDDLSQEATVRYFRATQRTRVVDNHDALKTTIARRTAVDFLRRQSVRARVEVDGEQGEDEVPGDWPDPLGAFRPPIEMMRFTTLEFFHQHDSGCLELAPHFFASRNWREVAEILGRSHDAVRTQWSRCVEILRQAARGSECLYWEWA